MSDDEEQVNTKSHKQLLQAISSLGKTQHIRKSTRDEPKLQQDEFQLVKAAPATKKSQPVGVNDIVQVLKGTKKHLNAGKQLKTVVNTKKVLDKPLEKPAAERIKRTIGYENVKKKLAKWDAVVAKNRSAETQVFPLKGETIYVNTSLNRKPLEQSVKSDLMMQMEELENKYAQLKRQQMGDTDDPQELQRREQELLKKKMTKEELIAKRKELAYLKMRESQKSAKARLQNKIKSKKYHKLLKRQKMQEQIKQFELLQKTNPEAALEKLNALEKSRVLERASLRHKNTGTWAKNLQVRAKYDKDVRKDLSEQLQISRQLTQKTQDDESDNENKEIENTGNSVAAQEDEEMDYDPFNPWTKVGKNSNKAATAEQEDKANWRKYWLERNDNEKMMEEYKKLLKDEEEEHESAEENVTDEETTEAQQKGNKKSAKKTKTAKLTKKSPKIENGWVVEEIDPTTTKSIDDIFDAQEDIIKENLSKKLEIIKNKAKELKAGNKKQIKRLGKTPEDALKNLKDLSFKNEVKKPIIDEELTNELDEKKDELERSKNLIEQVEKEDNATKALSDTIDPTKLAAVKLKQHGIGYGSINETLDDVAMDEEDELDADAEQQMTIAQAFEDDDIVADFSKDKTKDSEVKDAEIQLSMPGWGSWAGAGISKEQMEKRNKRLLLKLAPKEKRRDENKDGVYINEEASKQLRQHLVSDIPFPFTSLKDYEASIRAPLGRNFVTETAFRLLTRPSVITQKGKIIEPMDESELLKPQRKLRNPVDIRIAKMSQDKKTKA
ncbi:U3 small nucleolar RNA-associated protein 14 homolog C [Lucilia cuprina]|uniref:U3 small nucleolar RNA-associated protein 14 homolog C n=1 Tax=Lucilia cuprina TaxID=7375 RepID=UPI001F06391E|nr:U3 small nucleolar RNA-associated protein 14 homolog C [Lucilia cuprina]